MPIDIASTIISGVASGETFKVKYSTTDIFKANSSRIVTKPNTIGFVAGNTGNTAVGPSPAASWSNVQNHFNIASPNVGTCFNTSNGRFTAPVTGVYIFIYSAYCINTATQDYGILPTFWVNGSSSLRRSSGYNLRSRGSMLPATYAWDLQMEETLSLTAADYVDIHAYHYSANTVVYPGYSFFSGFLIG